MSERKHAAVGDLVGEVLKYVDVDERGNEIILTTESGRRFIIYHDQECCETVKIEDTQGNWHELVGKVITEATHRAVEREDPPPEYPDSWTRTTLTFRVDGATVITRWIGESNGYYSEDVDIAEIVAQSQEPDRGTQPAE